MHLLVVYQKEFLYDNLALPEKRTRNISKHSLQEYVHNYPILKYNR